MGSSPRVRGKRDAAGGLQRPDRLIPACAGKTSPPSSPPSKAWAHPRVCGENQKWSVVRVARLGSSPRVRGKRGRSAMPVSTGRLIPACAGKTARTATTRARQRAHPRVCGENSIQIQEMSDMFGSSPRVRGKHGFRDCAVDAARLIPACAGKTWTRPAGPRPRPAHPRVCGENLRGRSGGLLEAGSSPRVRGKRPAAGGGPREPGLIPACAGKTSRILNPARRLAAHPRVCGENSVFFAYSDRSTGSSPRVRGKRPRRRRSSRTRGLIPACAGKTS